MKLNFVLPSLGISGGNRVVFEYANRLSERGHEVTILYPAIPNRMAESWFDLWARATQVFDTGNRLVSGNGVDWFDLDVPVQRIPTLAPNLVGLFEDRVPDADVTIATAWQTAYTVSVLDDSKGEKAYFVQHYEIWETWNSDDAWQQVTALTDNPASYPIEMYEVTPQDDKAKREKKLVDRTYELPLSKITISPWLSELLQTKFNEDVVDVVPNSVNHSTFYPESTSASGSLSILLPYRDASWKGRREAKILIDQLRSTDIEIHTYGSGDPSDLPQSVEHHTNITDKKLRQLYSNADIFVLTAWVEGFGLPPLEAMACKCAVVATRVGSIPDYADDGKTASIVPPRDSQTLIEATKKLIENRQKRHRFQKQGYNRSNEYRWEDATTQMEGALELIVDI